MCIFTVTAVPGDLCHSRFNGAWTFARFSSAVWSLAGFAGGMTFPNSRQISLEPRVWRLVLLSSFMVAYTSPSDLSNFCIVQVPSCIRGPLQQRTTRIEGEPGAVLRSCICSTQSEHPLSHRGGWGPRPKWERICHVPATLNISTSLTQTALLYFPILYSNPFSVVAPIEKRNRIVNNPVVTRVG